MSLAPLAHDGWELLESFTDSCVAQMLRPLPRWVRRLERKEKELWLELEDAEVELHSDGEVGNAHEDHMSKVI